MFAVMHVKNGTCAHNQTGTIIWVHKMNMAQAENCSLRNEALPRDVRLQIVIIMHEKLIKPRLNYFHLENAFPCSG